MARIRTIKPELWTDDGFVECSSNARLLFVAGLNFASDYGVLPDKPRTLKMQCFPADDVDVLPLIDELLEHRLWLRATAPDGAPVLVIRTFAQHQRVDKPTLGRWGDPAEWRQSPVSLPEQSESTPGGLAEASPTEGKGREGNIAGATKALRDTVWDVLALELGPAETETARTNRGRTVKELVAVGVDPANIAARCAAYRHKYPNAALTDAALRKHWSDLNGTDSDFVIIDGERMQRSAL